MDRYWSVPMTNDSAPKFFDCFIDTAARKGPHNILHLVFDRDGLRPLVATGKALQRVWFNAFIGSRWPV
jgi:hypothetical protein